MQSREFQDQGTNSFDTKKPSFFVLQRPKAEKQYREFLASIGFSPEKIIERFKQDGIKTVLLEYTQRGESLASFLSIVFLWSKEQNMYEDLASALDVCILKQNFCDIQDIVLQDEGIVVPCANYRVSDHFIVPLANGKDEGCDSPHYNESKFGIPPASLMPDNECTRFKIISKIRTEIQKQNNPNPPVVQGIFFDSASQSSAARDQQHNAGGSQPTCSII
jgi:hypothetical protein